MACIQEKMGLSYGFPLQFLLAGHIGFYDGPGKVKFIICFSTFSSGFLPCCMYLNIIKPIKSSTLALTTNDKIFREN